MTAPIKGIDCATPLTAATATAIAATGNDLAARYLVPEGYSKRLTRREAEDITAAGMRIVSVYETAADRPAGGAASGIIDGTVALKEALSIGQTPGSAIYFAADFDASAMHYDAIEDYLRAAAKQIGGYEAGIYGEHDVIEEMYRRGAAKHYWQTRGWSAGKRSAHANLYQYDVNKTLAGIGVDYNYGYGSEGAWDTHPPAAPQPAGEDNIKVVVNDKLAAYGRIIDGHVYLPLRQLGEALGKAVDWDNINKVPYVDGHEVEAFSLIGNTTYVGVRAAAELLGAIVSWDGTTKKVYLYK